MVVGQDVHQRKHLSPLFIQTPSRDVIGDLAAGRYAFRSGNRCWTEDQLAKRRLAIEVQRVRTPLMRYGMDGYRRAHRIMHRTRMRRAIWDVALRAARYALSPAD